MGGTEFPFPTIIASYLAHLNKDDMSFRENVG